MKITIGNKDVEVGPLTISQYETIKSGKDMNDMETISFFTGLPISEIKKADYQQIIFVSKFITAHIASEMNKNSLDLSLEYKGELLGLIRPSKMSYGEYSDLHVLLSEEQPEYRKVIAILYRPLLSGTGDDRVIQEYDYDECQLRSKDMGDFPVKNYLSALFFLTMFNKESLKDSPSYLETLKKIDETKKMREEIKEQKKNS